MKLPDGLPHRGTSSMPPLTGESSSVVRARQAGMVRGAELPSGLAALVADLQDLGFRVVRAESHPWPRGWYVELARRRRRGIGRVRMTEDRGVWDVEALSHAERRVGTPGVGR